MDPHYHSRRFHPTLLVLASAVALTVVWVSAQTAPSLAAYYTEIPSTVIDPGYAPAPLGWHLVNTDLDGDGYQDLVVLGFDLPGLGVTFGTPRPGRVYLGDGDGHFTPASTASFPIDTLYTITPSEILFADFNADGRPDMFIACHGFDADPFPGEQNHLYLSLPEGGWRDATDTLPQLSDMSVAATTGDISGRGLLDIFVVDGPIGLAGVSSHFLLNNGSGQFTRTTANIPVTQRACGNPGQAPCKLLDYAMQGATLADLNDDGLPELIVTGRANSKIPNETILWNRGGVFTDADATQLPDPGILLPNARWDADAERLDVNQDGLQDLVLVGTQAPSYAGWWVQILVNKGNRMFVDETADRVPHGQASGGTDGPRGNSTFAVEVLDFNQDGAPDFFIGLTAGVAGTLKPDQPLIWINDGTGHFSTLKVGDFVAAGKEAVLGGSPHLVATRHGYSFTTLRSFTGSGGLKLMGVLATKPYRIPGSHVIPRPVVPLPPAANDPGASNPPPPDDSYSGYRLRQNRRLRN